MYIHLTETNKYWKLSSLFPSYTLAFHYIAAWDTMYSYKSASLFPVLTAQSNLQFFWRIFYQVAERIAQCVWGLEGANLNTTFNYSIATAFCNQHLTHNSKLKRKLAYIQLEKHKKGKEKKRKPRHKKHFVKPFLCCLVTVILQCSEFYPFLGKDTDLIKPNSSSLAVKLLLSL